MFHRAATNALRRAPRVANTTRTFAITTTLRSSPPTTPSTSILPPGFKTLDEIKTEEDLLPPGAPPGTVPTDYNQSTGLERLEILGKIQGVDIFDMRPLDASRRGTLEDPIVLGSYGKERYLGCTGFPADSHITTWLTISRSRPLERCPECGGVYKMEYLGKEEEEDHHAYVEPKTFADFVKEEYRYR